MPENNWDLDNIISESDRKDIAVATTASRAARHVAIKPFWRKAGFHQRSPWAGITIMAFQSQQESTGLKQNFEYGLQMRACFKCGEPQIRIRRRG